MTHIWRNGGEPHDDGWLRKEIILKVFFHVAHKSDWHQARSRARRLNSPRRSAEEILQIGWLFVGCWRLFWFRHDFRTFFSLTTTLITLLGWSGPINQMTSIFSKCRHVRQCCANERWWMDLGTKRRAVFKKKLWLLWVRRKLRNKYWARLAQRNLSFQNSLEALTPVLVLFPYCPWRTLQFHWGSSFLRGVGRVGDLRYFYAALKEQFHWASSLEGGPELGKVSNLGHLQFIADHKTPDLHNFRKIYFNQFIHN